MNNYVFIKVKNELNRFINKCVRENISLSNISYYDNYLIVKIPLEDYDRVKRINYYSNIEVYRYDGLIGIKKHIRDNLFFYIILFICFLFMDVVTNYVVSINVIHENKRIRTLVYDELKKNNIYKYGLKYSFKDLERIKNKILRDNPNTLEWLSISNKGMIYEIRVEERIINKKEEITSCRSIIAKKDAYITKVSASKGDILIRSGEYVKKGDTLVDGVIKLYDNVKGCTYASGSIYGEVWYSVQISIPKMMLIKKYTGKSRYNVNINNKIFLRNKYKLFYQDNIKEYKLFGIKIKIYKEKEYVLNKIIISSNESENIALNRAKDELNKKINEKGKVISQKVLKKEENDSTIDYRIFMIANEEISDYNYFEEGDYIDSEGSN